MDINTSDKLLHPRATRSTATTNRVLPTYTHQTATVDLTEQEEGAHEQAVHEASKKAEDKQLVNELIKQSNRCIIRISSLFPWDIFPNTVEVEESRVTFTFRQFLTSQSHSVNIKDISEVIIDSSPFFATLQIVSRTFVQNEITVNHLASKKAHKVQMIIEGLRTFVEHNIDTSIYQIPELIAKIEEFHAHKTLS